MAVDARTGRAFITAADDIAVLDSRRGTLLRMATADGARGIAMDAERGLVFVAAGTQLLKLDATTGAVCRSIRLHRNGNVAPVALDRHHGRIFVALLNDVTTDSLQPSGRPAVRWPYGGRGAGDDAGGSTVLRAASA